MDNTKRTYPDNQTGYIRFAYDELSDDDKINVDIQVKRILDRFAKINAERTGAKFQMSRDMAFELIFNLGAFLKNKAVMDEHL